MTKVSLTVNGSLLSAEVEPRTHLADLLRETHNLTGTHIGCEHGVCGACTLLVDGVPIRSCITFAVACENAKVTTIEGLDEDEIARELRAAFTAHHALQCGYCTPGMIVSARDIVLRMEALERARYPRRDERQSVPMHRLRRHRAGDPERPFRPTRARRRAGPRRRPRPVGAGRIGARRRNTGGCRRGRRFRGVRVAPRLAAASATARVEADWKPQLEFRQSFVLAHPVDEVWAFFGRVEDVAACLPGASLDGGEKDGAVNGKIRVKVGPISAEFGGVAQITSRRGGPSRRDRRFRPRHPQQLRDARRHCLLRQARRERHGLPRRGRRWLHPDGNAGAIQPHRPGPGFGKPSDGRFRAQSRGAPFHRRGQRRREAASFGPRT